MSPDILWDCYRPLTLVQATSAIIMPSLLNSDSTEVMISLARIVALFDSVCTDLWHRSPPSLLYSDNSVEVAALVRLDSIIVYFIAL